MSKQKIAILVVGSILRDPSINNLIKQAIIKFYNNEVQTVLCPPVGDIITPQVHTKALEGDIVRRANLVKNYQKYFTHNSHLIKPFITLENQIKLRTKLNDMLFLNNNSFNENSSIVKQIVESLTLVEADKELITLLKVISKLDVPYVGIVDKSIVTNNLKELDNQFNTMAHKVYDNALPALNESNGVIICDIGINYSPELAVRLAKLAKSNCIDADMKIYSIFPHSAYVSDQVPHSNYASNEILAHKDLLQQLHDCNTAEDKQIYKKTPCVDMFVKENYENGAFYAPEFTKTIGDIIEYVSDHN